MLAPPDDLAEEPILRTLSSCWAIDGAEVAYLPLGFGSHHWQVTAPNWSVWFATVDDLRSKRRDAHDTTDAAFERLTQAFDAVRALRDDGGLGFVVAPLAGRDGTTVARLDDRYTLVVHPFLAGHNPGQFGAFHSADDRVAVLELLVELHAATAVAAPHAGVDDLAVPHHRDLDAAIAAQVEPWSTGPYGERARQLLGAHERGVRQLIRAYESLAAGVRERGQFVITHGEPHAGNVYVVDGAHLLIDWDTALIAPPERDLWVLDPGDGSIIDGYRTATGVEVHPEALDLYRMWWDLDEIGGYLEVFRHPHGDDPNSAQCWKGLEEYLQPEARWPQHMR